MPWTESTRVEYERKGMRYASDCTKEEWEILERLMPPPSKVGRPRKRSMREIWNAIQYISATGCQWAQLPKDFPPFTTVQYHFYRLRDSGTLDAMNETLVMASRLCAGRKDEPTAGVIDSQSVKTTESGGPRGYDAGKKIKGRKRHIITDTQGNMLAGQIHTADVQDRDGAVTVIADVQASFPTVTHLFADGGYAGEKLATTLRRIKEPCLQIIKRSDTAKGFVILARRWVVERTFAWLNRCRRLAKDWEATIASSSAWLLLSSIRRQSRYLAKKQVISTT